MPRRLVVLINPPNTQSSRAGSVTRGEEHSDWANYAHAGLLTLASALVGTALHPVYFDGVVCPVSVITQFISDNHAHILIVGASVLTANYEAAMDILSFTKDIDHNIVTIAGNDHFTALAETCLRARRRILDCGFVGNDTVASFVALAKALSQGASISELTFPSMASLRKDVLCSMPSQAEPILEDIEYGLLDEAFNHTSIYEKHFQQRVSPVLASRLGLRVDRGVPVEIARGCIKFRNNDACSFCSIQYDHKWKNELKNTDAVMHKLLSAVNAGYNYLYITADELPLTFRALLIGLHEHLQLASSPSRSFSGNGVVLAGYARADGLAQASNAEVLRGIGVRVLMIGIDAGTPLSLKALNKPLRLYSPRVGEDELHLANQLAITNAARVGIGLRLGFVVGHLGMTRELLSASVKTAHLLLSTEKHTILSVDAELLSPEPGSMEFRYLTEPHLADCRAQDLGVHIADRALRDRIANKWKYTDMIDREDAIADYIKAFMPELTMAELIAARQEIRAFAVDQGVLVGE